MKGFAWAIFQDVDSDGHWSFHSAHWNRERARYFAKGLDGKTKVKKIEYQEAAFQALTARIEPPAATGATKDKNVDEQKQPEKALNGGSRSNVELGPDVRPRHEIILDLVEARKRIFDLEARLREIGDYAHKHSAGPDAPDELCLWKVFEMAYELV